MKKKNLMHVVFNLNSGGVEQMLLNYFRTDIFNDYNIYIAYFGNADERCITEFIKIGITPIQVKNRTKKLLSCYKELKQIFKKYKIDIVHSNMNIENYVVLKAAHDANVDLKISHSHGLPSPSNNLLKKIVRKTKKIIVNKYSDVNLACSTKAGNYLFGENNYKIIYNAIDIKKFKYNEEIRKKMRKELNINNEVLIGYIARFTTDKNHEFLIDLIDIMQNKKIKVLLIGMGPLKDKIINIVKTKGLENNFIFLNTKENISDYYQAMDLFLFPSIEEGLGMVAIESQLNDLYCICSKGIPYETKISDNIVFVDLDKEKWIKEINNHLKVRTNNTNNISNKDKYDISKQRKVLKEIYERK